MHHATVSSRNVHSLYGTVGGRKGAPTRTNWGQVTVSDGRHQPIAAASSADPVSNPDSSTSDIDVLNGLQAELRTVQQAPPTAFPGGGTAGGYSVSPAQLQNWINELQNILDSANHRYQYIKVIEESGAAAGDDSSGKANGAFQHTGSLLRRANDAIRNYAGKTISLFKESLQAYERTEQSNQDTLRGAGKGH